MNLSSSRNFLRYVLWADSLSTLACGLLQVTATGALAKISGLSASLLLGTGEFLLVCGTVVAFLAVRRRTPNAILWLLIAGNVLWAIAGVALMFGNGGLTAVGYAYILVQVIAVAALAALQYFAVRRSAQVTELNCKAPKSSAAPFHIT
jgi:hypothetical protein